MFIIFEFINILKWLIVIDALLSWFIPPRSNSFSRMIGVVIDPIVAPFRKLQDRFISGIPADFSPLFAIIFLTIVQAVLKTIVY